VAGRERLRRAAERRGHAVARRVRLLEISNLEVVYDDVIAVLRGISLRVPDGQIVALLGPNGAGKTTTLRAICGLLDLHDGKATKGAITYRGGNLLALRPQGIAAAGVVQVMEGRRIFIDLTVEENLRAGAYWPSDATSSRATCPAASSRCSRSAARCSRVRRC
jgi:branched-chain amino acid transport system ATP-binding protein